MTKTTKALLTGAAFAGLFAGTASATQASTLLPSLKTSFSALGQSQDQDKKDDKQVKEKHACKGQNSCKGKGGCKTVTTVARQELLQGQGRLRDRWLQASRGSLKSTTTRYEGWHLLASILREKSGNEYAWKSLYGFSYGIGIACVLPTTIFSLSQTRCRLV
jgi:hypothetical protein